MIQKSVVKICTNLYVKLIKIICKKLLTLNLKFVIFGMRLKKRDAKMIFEN